MAGLSHGKSCLTTDFANRAFCYGVFSIPLQLLFTAGETAFNDKYNDDISLDCEFLNDQESSPVLFSPRLYCESVGSYLVGSAAIGPKAYSITHNLKCIV